MYEDELVRVKKRIDSLHNDCRLQNHPIIMVGVSDNTRHLIRMVEGHGYRVSWVIDNDLAKKGSNCYQIPVKPVVELSGEEISKAVYFIYSFFWREMKSQLLEIGVDEDRIYSFFLPDRTLEEQFEMAEKGMAMCESFREKIGDYPIFLCPYTGTGDIYLIGTFWNEYLKRNNISDYIFVVVSKACAKVAEIFNIRNVQQITQVEGSYIVEFYKLCGEKTGIKILNDSWLELRANPLQRFRGFKGLYFTEIFRKFVFDFEDNVKPVQPELKNVDSELLPVFDKYQLRVGNTVVLSPYSNTLSDLPMAFWTELSEDLKIRGFDVCTNCGADEIPIDRTKAVFVPLNIAPQFIEKAGFFVGVRSGFCDCISAADAKKIILYDKRNRFINCSAFEYFSLKNMGLCEDAVELEYETEHTDALKEQILSYFEGLKNIRARF